MLFFKVPLLCSFAIPPFFEIIVNNNEKHYYAMESIFSQAAFERGDNGGVSMLK